MSSKLAMRLAKPGLPLVPEPAFGLQTIGSVPQSQTAGPNSVANANHWVGSLNQTHLTATFEDSIVAARQLAFSKID